MRKNFVSLNKKFFFFFASDMKKRFRTIFVFIFTSSPVDWESLPGLDIL